MNDILKHTIRFFILASIQILVLNNVQISGYINPFVYILFIMLLPPKMPKAIVLILAFIMIIATFNIIGALSMLMLDKKKDIQTFRSLGATRNEVQQILDAIPVNEQFGTRDKAIMELLYACGLRVSEACELKLSLLRITEGYIIVTGKGNKERLVPVDQNTLSTIEKYLKVRVEFLNADKNEDKWLFPSRNSKLGHISRQRFHQLLKVLCKEANIDAKYVSPHKLRHAFASHLLANGMDLRSLQMLLGHSDISTTQIYTHVLSDRLKSTVEDNHPLSKVFKE